MINQFYQSHLGICLSLFIILSFAFELRGKQPSLDPARTHAVIVGVLHWQDKSLTRYSAVNRKDRELYEVLVEIGVPKKNMFLLLDEEGKLSNIRNAIRKIARGAQKGDTFIFYYAGHGVSAVNGVCFMNYDVGKAPSFAVKEIAEILKNDFRGSQVLMFADCCYSGGLGRTAKSLSEHGFKAASITSADVTNASTGNWTFTHILVDTFRGRPAADRNGDQVITLDEAASEVADAMKYRESQQHGQSRFKIPGDFRLCKVSKQQSVVAIPTPFKLFEYVQVKAGNRWQPARIVDFQNGELALEIQQYSTRKIVKADLDRVRKFPPVKLKTRIPVHTKPPKVLGEKELLAKARVGGKYKTLLKRIKVEGDYRSYSYFNDFGYYQSTGYAGHENLPAGYWVYVYPFWHIWESENKGTSKLDR